MPDLWMVGYGLDDRQVKRGWSSLFMIPKVNIVKTIRKDELDALLEGLDDDCTLKKSVRIGNTEIFISVHPCRSRHVLAYRCTGKIICVNCFLKLKYH